MHRSCFNDWSRVSRLILPNVRANAACCAPAPLRHRTSVACSARAHVCTTTVGVALLGSGDARALAFLDQSSLEGGGRTCEGCQ